MKKNVKLFIALTASVSFVCIAAIANKKKKFSAEDFTETAKCEFSSLYAMEIQNGHVDTDKNKKNGIEEILNWMNIKSGIVILCNNLTYEKSEERSLYELVFFPGEKFATAYKKQTSGGGVISSALNGETFYKNEDAAGILGVTVTVKKHGKNKYLIGSQYKWLDVAEKHSGLGNEIGSALKKMEITDKD